MEERKIIYSETEEHLYKKLRAVLIFLSETLLPVLFTQTCLFYTVKNK